MKRCFTAVMCSLAVVALVAIPASAQPTILKGSDLFATAAGTFADFSTNPIPAGFFCPGSPAFAGAIPLSGVPLTTVPAGVAAGTDTIVERLTDGVFAADGTASMAVIVRALQLRGTLTVNCASGPTTWTVNACLCGTQPVTKIVAKLTDDACGCGTFSGGLQLRVCLTFTRGSVTLGPITQTINLNINNMSWCYQPAAGTAAPKDPFAVDTNCDRCPDQQVPGVTNFHPGWTCDSIKPGTDCLTEFGHLTTCHDNPGGDHLHCVNPVCDRRQ